MPGEATSLYATHAGKPPSWKGAMPLDTPQQLHAVDVAPPISMKIQAVMGAQTADSAEVTR